jgi:hypothetical protein
MIDPDADGDDPTPELDLQDLQQRFGWPLSGSFAPGELKEVLRLRGEGMSYRALAAATGRGFSHIGRVCKAAGLDSDVARPPQPVKAATPEQRSPLSTKLHALSEKAAKQADLLIHQMNSPLKVKRVNTRSGVTERFTVPKPDPDDQAKLSQGFRNLVYVVETGVKAEADSGQSKGAILDLVWRLRQEDIDASELPDSKKIALINLKGQLTRGEITQAQYTEAYQKIVAPPA